MATIRKSKVDKYTYWQIVESKRIDGKPRPVVLARLGTAEQLLYKLRKEPLEQKTRSVSHGAVELLYKTATSLELPYIFEQNAYFAFLVSKLTLVPHFNFRSVYRVMRIHDLYIAPDRKAYIRALIL